MIKELLKVLMMTKDENDFVEKGEDKLNTRGQRK
jgi:hypothetical protein